MLDNLEIIKNNFKQTAAWTFCALLIGYLGTKIVHWIRNNEKPSENMDNCIKTVNRTIQNRIINPNHDIIVPLLRFPDLGVGENGRGRVNKILVYNDLIIAINKRAVFALNKNTYQEVWSSFVGNLSNCNLDNIAFDFKATSLGVTFVSSGDLQVGIINPENGIITTVALPAAPTHNKHKIYITPSKFCYFENWENHKFVLYGGFFSNTGWIPNFKLQKPSGFSHSLGNYVYYKIPHEKYITVVSQDGSQKMLPNCTSLLQANGKLFSVELPDDQISGSIVTVGLLDQDSTIFQPPIVSKKIHIPVKDLKLMGLCSDNSLVCFFEDSNNRTIYFIDIDNKQLLEVEHKNPIYGKYYIDTKKNAIWTWEAYTKILWKHTKESSTNIGKIDFSTSERTFISHVDEKEIVYFVDPNHGSWKFFDI